ncbi:MAG: ImmA/IrrE family metallo-endopeptidase [Deltaproteobacteria bacterium]|nr:ImmA/IrrE family metallo-endopeptidase [Deltaproteobacteria bacterium]
MFLDVEYLKYKQIAEEAAKFLKETGDHSIPVPIEHIIDFRYGINIIPVPGLLDSFETDGFIASDFSCIYIDNFVYERRYYRYRFTLAHEIAHLILHERYLNKCKFSNVAEWKTFHSEIDANDHSKMETQGYCFGGLVLVPQVELKKYFMEYLPGVMPLIEQAKSKGISRKDYLSYVKDSLAASLSPIFEVSIDVLNRRIDFDSLGGLIP